MDTLSCLWKEHCIVWTNEIKLKRFPFFRDLLHDWSPERTRQVYLINVFVPIGISTSFSNVNVR